MHMAGWNTGKKCDTLMYVCRFRVACFRSMANRKAFTTSSCESKCAGLLLPLFLSVDRIAVVNLHLTRVWIQDHDGHIVEECVDPRASFAGHVLKTRWDRLHMLYFTSYAMSNYLTIPLLFTLPGVDVLEIRTHKEHG